LSFRKIPYILARILKDTTTGKAGIPSQMPRGSVKLSAILVG
jgi:hypothetical protein